LCQPGLKRKIVRRLLSFGGSIAFARAAVSLAWRLGRSSVSVARLVCRTYLGVFEGISFHTLRSEVSTRQVTSDKFNQLNQGG